jgi:cytochrome c oxidase subunit 1
MTFWRMPLSSGRTSRRRLLVVLATPFIAGSQFFVMFDRLMHTNFFDFNGGRLRARLPAHLLVLLAPGRLHHDAARLRDRLGGDLRLRAETDLRLPADGAVADGDPRARLLGLGAPHVRLRDVALAPHPDDGRRRCSSPIPTGIKVFCWLRTLWEGRIHFKTPMLFALGFVSMFVIGGLSGIYLGASRSTSTRRHVLRRRAHPLRALRRLLFTIFAGIYYWFPKMTAGCTTSGSGSSTSG